MTGNEISKLTKLQAILDAAIDAIVSINSHGTVESFNKAAEGMFGYRQAEIIGKNIKLLMPEPWASEHDEYIRRYLETGKKKIIGIGREVEGKRKSGEVFPIHLTISEYHVGQHAFFTGIIHDLTSRKKMENALHQARKMEAIGQLTGGIAHDFNNLLTIITGNLELLDANLGGSGSHDLLKEALEAADLGAELTNRLLAFARRSILRPEILNLNLTVLSLVKLLKRTLGSGIGIETELEKELWLSKFDPAALESAILNLALNARDALPDGGKLILETSNQVIDEDYAEQEFGVLMGEYVRISVTDSGEGIAPEILGRVLEPFFTTKSPGKGTGLGLSMVYGYAKQSGGHCTIYSEPGVGTTVNIYLPRHSGAQKVEMKPGKGSSPKPGGSRKQIILVVEDDPRVRQLSKRRLEALGYQLILASDGDKAIKIIEQDKKAGRKINLVFTDLVMPGGVDGYELIKHVREIRPELKVLLTSGYAEDLINSDRLETLHVPLLRKPYRQKDLAEAIANALVA